MELSRYEMETIINFNEAETTADIYTHNRALRQKLEMWALNRPAECRLVRTSHNGKAVEYIVPKAWLRVKPPRAMLRCFPNGKRGKPKLNAPSWVLSRV